MGSHPPPYSKRFPAIALSYGVLAHLNAIAMVITPSLPPFSTFLSRPHTPATYPTAYQEKKGDATLSALTSPALLRSESLDFLLIGMDIPSADEVDAVGHRGEYRLKALRDTFGLARQIDNQAFAPDARGLTR